MPVTAVEAGGEPRGEAEMAAVARVSGDGWEWRQ